MPTTKAKKTMFEFALQTKISDYQALNEKLLPLLLTAVPGLPLSEELPSPSEDVDIAWSMIVHNLVQIKYINVWLKTGKSPTEKEIKAFYPPAKEEAEKLISEYMLRLSG